MPKAFAAGKGGNSVEGPATQSGPDVLEHLALGVRQSLVMTGEADGRSLVVDPQAVEQRREEVVDLQSVFARVVAVIVRGVLADGLPFSRHRLVSPLSSRGRERPSAPSRRPSGTRGSV